MVDRPSKNVPVTRPSPAQGPRWDDETSPAVNPAELDSPFDRVTAVPDLPPELYARRLMANAAESLKGRNSDTDAPTIRPDDSQTKPPSPAGAEAQQEVAPTATAPQNSLLDMRDRYAVGDYSGALLIAENILAVTPDNAQAELCADKCREVLTKMYTARLGALDRVLQLAVESDQIRWLSLDHRAGFLLSLVDGNCTIDEILDMSGMQRFDALKLLCTLLDQRVVTANS